MLSDLSAFLLRHRGDSLVLRTYYSSPHASLYWPTGIALCEQAAITWRRRQLCRVIQATRTSYSTFFRFLRFLGGVDNVVRCRVEQCGVRCLYVQSCQESCRYYKYKGRRNFGLGHVPSAEYSNNFPRVLS
jgi:hypothetical protein